MLDVGDGLASGNAAATRVVLATGGIVLHLVGPGTDTAARAWIPATDVEQAVAVDTSGVAGCALSFGTPAVMHPYPRRFRFTSTGALVALLRACAEDAPGLPPRNSPARSSEPAEPQRMRTGSGIGQQARLNIVHPDPANDHVLLHQGPAELFPQ